MNSSNVESCMKKFKGEISEDKENEVRRNIKALPDEEASKFLNLKFKSPKNTVILSSVLGFCGGGSFYLGRIRRGLLKIACFLVLPILIGVIFIGQLAPIFASYKDSGAEYLEFSTYSVPKMKYFGEFEYKRVTVDGSTGKAEGEEQEAGGEDNGEQESDGENKKKIKLTHKDFTSDINSAYDLYSMALGDLNDHFSAVTKKAEEINSVVSDEKFGEKLSGLNGNFAEISGQASVFSENLKTFAGDLEDLFDFGAQSQDPESDNDKLFDSMIGSLNSAAVAVDKELMADINDLVDATGKLHSLDLGSYISALGAVNFDKLITLNENFTGTVKDNLTKVDSDVKDGKISSVVSDIGQTLSALAVLNNQITSADKNLEILKSATVADGLEEMKKIITEEPPADQDSSTEKDIVFAELLQRVIEGLASAEANDGENEHITKALESLEKIQSNLQNLSNFEDDINVFFSENENNQTENKAAVFAKAISDARSNNFFDNLLKIVDASKNLSLYSQNIISIYRSGVFQYSAMLVCQSATETLLKYYIGIDVNFNYNIESGESLLYYNFANYNKPDPLGTNAKLKIYYDNSKDIVDKMQNELTDTTLQLKDIKNDLAEMKTVVNSLNETAKDKISDWSITESIIVVYFSVILALGAIIIISYWVGEVFNDKKYCYKTNYEKIVEVFNGSYKPDEV